MRFDEPHKSPGERFSYQTRHVVITNLQSVSMYTTFLYLPDETGFG